MKTSIVLVALLSFLAVSTAYSHGRDRFKKSRESVPASIHNEKNIKDMESIREHMNEMQVFMSEAQKTEDMGKRQALMNKHMDGIKNALGEMQDMMTNDIREGHSNNRHRKLKDMDIEQRQDNIESRIDMLLMIMKQMIQRESLLTE